MWFSEALTITYNSLSSSTVNFLICFIVSSSLISNNFHSTRQHVPSSLSSDEHGVSAYWRSSSALFDLVLFRSWSRSKDLAALISLVVHVCGLCMKALHKSNYEFGYLNSTWSSVPSWSIDLLMSTGSPYPSFLARMVLLLPVDELHTIKSFNHEKRMHNGNESSNIGTERGKSLPNQICNFKRSPNFTMHSHMSLLNTKMWHFLAKKQNWP